MSGRKPQPSAARKDLPASEQTIVSDFEARCLREAAQGDQIAKRVKAEQEARDKLAAASQRVEDVGSEYELGTTLEERVSRLPQWVEAMAKYGSLLQSWPNPGWWCEKLKSPDGYTGRGNRSY